MLWVFAIFWHFTTGEWRQYIPTRNGLFAVMHHYHSLVVLFLQGTASGASHILFAPAIAMLGLGKGCPVIQPGGCCAWVYRSLILCRLIEKLTFWWPLCFHGAQHASRPELGRGLAFAGCEEAALNLNRIG